jgi:hypothetical protein
MRVVVAQLRLIQGTIRDRDFTLRIVSSQDESLW